MAHEVDVDEAVALLVSIRDRLVLVNGSLGSASCCSGGGWLALFSAERLSRRTHGRSAKFDCRWPAL
jgi:hypothetical protein